MVDECAKASFHVVVVAPHIGPFSISDGPANSGDMVSATCSIMKGDFPVEIVWKFNGRAIGFNDPDLTITRINRHMSALSIESVAARHAGEYTCVATNRAGNVTHSTTLAVNGIYTKETSTLARQTSFAHCHRLIKEKTEKKRKKKDSIPIIPSSTFLFSPPLPFVVRNDETTKREIPSFVHTHAHTHIYISVSPAIFSVAPQIFPFTFGDEPVNSGEAISATCSILKGDFPMDITWALDGSPIDSERSDQYTITKSKRLSVLAIDAVAARHAGEYTCTASNKAGASSHTAALAVNGNER